MQLPPTAAMRQGAIGLLQTAEIDAAAPRPRSDLLSGSRTARLTRALVQTGRVYSASAVSGYPADKHACAMLLCAPPVCDHPLPTGLPFLPADKHACAMLLCAALCS